MQVIDFRSELIAQWIPSQSARTVFDYSGYGNHGSLFSATLRVLDPKGQIALDYDGASDHIDFGDNNMLDMGTKDWSVFVHFKWETIGNTFPTLVGKYGGAFGWGVEIVNDGGANDGKIRAWIKNATTRINALSSQATAKDGTWHTVAVVWDRDANLTVYLDTIAGTGSDISS